MGRIRKFVGYAALASGACFMSWFVPAKMGMFASDRQEMIERYAQSPSRFITVNGVPIHVSVEGKGFPLIMLHGTGVNLHEWDPTAERLKDEYQIVRLDWPPYGLSGPNPKGYSTAEAARLVKLVMDELKIEQAVFIATSNGSNVALTLNANHPERVKAMAFSIIPLERPAQKRSRGWKLDIAVPFHEAVMPEYRPRIYYQWVFDNTGHKGWKVPPYLPQMMADMSNLPDAIKNQKQYIASNTKLFLTTDVGAIAEKVTVPVLLQWCWEDTVISQGPEATVKRFTNTKVETVEYKNVGHWPMWEIPDLFADDIRKFLKTLDLDAAPVAGPAPQADGAADSVKKAV